MPTASGSISCGGGETDGVSDQLSLDRVGGNLNLFLCFRLFETKALCLRYLFDPPAFYRTAYNPCEQFAVYASPDGGKDP